MATQYTSILKLALPVTGELSGTWGDVVNNNITSMIEQAIAGLSTINTWTANAHTLTVADGTTSESRCAMLVAATGAGGTALTAAGEIICPAASKLYVLKNGAAYAVTLKTAAGTGVAVPAGDTAFLFCDGTNVNACVTTIVNGHISGNLTVDGNTTLGDANTDTVTVTAQFASDLLPSTDNARDLGSTAKSWRTLYCDTSVLVGNLSLAGNTLSSTDTNGNIVIAPNGTGDVQLDADTVRVGDSNANATITTNGTGDLILNTNAGTNSGSITIEDGVNGNIIIAPNGTGQVQITNAALDLTTIEVSNINAKDGTAAITIADSTGAVGISTAVTMSATTQNIALGTSQTTGTFTVGGAAQTGALTLDQSTKTHTLNLGTGATENALTKTINIGTAGVSGSTTTITIGSANGTSTTLNGTVTAATFNSTTIDTTNIEVTNIKAKDGTAALSIADSTGVVSVSANPILSGGTANGVVYLNASKAATSGTALTFDGTNLAISTGKVTTSTAGASAGFQWGGTTTTSRLYDDGSGNAYLDIGAGASNSSVPLFIRTKGAGGIVYVQPNGVNAYVVEPANQIWSISGSEQMRLTSTGLGIGTSSPNSYAKLTLEKSGGDSAIAMVKTGGSQTAYLATDGTNAWIGSSFGSTGKKFFVSLNAPDSAATLDSSGNLGIGVTPSSWGSSYKALQNIAGFFSSDGNGANYTTVMGNNAYFDSSDVRWEYYRTANGASLYRQNNSTTGAAEHAWYTAPSGTAGNAISFTQAMTLDASGNLGIGTTSPGYKLDVQGTTPAIRLKTAGVGTGFKIEQSNATGDVELNVIDGYPLIFKTTNTERARITSGGDFRVKGAGTAGSTDAFQISGSAPADAARLTSDGNLYVGVVSPATAGKIVADGGDAFYAGTFAQPSSASNCIAVHNRGTSGDNAFVIFGTEAAFTTRGSIDYNRAGGQVRYNTTSDYRAKEVYGPVTDSGAQIDALKVYQGKMIGATQERPMMIAHEAQEVVPYAVGGEKDAVNADGTPKYQTMDHQILVPLLIAELQSLRARVAQLEGK